MLKLDKYTKKDYTLFSEVVFNEETMTMNMGRTFTDEEAKMFFQAILSCNAESTDLGFFKVYLTNDNASEYIGMAALTQNEDFDALEIEYMLLPQYWNKGYGTNLVNLLLQMANETYKDTNVVAITDPANTYSKRILQRTGFQLAKQYVNDDNELAELYVKINKSAEE